MEITESNKLIALFYGAEYKSDDYGQMGYFFNKPFVENWHTSFMAEALKFNTSWDWLMPIVEKIGTIGYPYDINPVCTNIGNFSLPYTYSEAGPNILENTYNAVVKFINWHNEQTKTGK